jgi:hypothetical protein
MVEMEQVVHYFLQIPGVKSTSIECVQLFDVSHEDSEYSASFPKVNDDKFDNLLRSQNCLSVVIDTPFGEKIRHRHVAYVDGNEDETLVVIPMEHLVERTLRSVQISVNLHFKGEVLEPTIYGLNST